mmetsp:Transcript_26922/g.22209  ORF Transcript_26922/g.22209 Transcript_26922/m.22209 type:complete len:122 (+) Transcript_26922:117-482(+)
MTKMTRNPLLFHSNGVQKQPFMYENKPDNVNTRFHTTDYERDFTEIQIENRAAAREEGIRERDNNSMALAGRFDPAKPGGYLATPSMVPGVDVTHKLIEKMRCLPSHIWRGSDPIERPNQQ